MTMHNGGGTTLATVSALTLFVSVAMLVVLPLDGIPLIVAFTAALVALGTCIWTMMRGRGGNAGGDAGGAAGGSHDPAMAATYGDSDTASSLFDNVSSGADDDSQRSCRVDSWSDSGGSDSSSGGDCGGSDSGGSSSD